MPDKYIANGSGVTVSFALGALSIKSKSLKPGGWDGGGPIPTTGTWNEAVRTQAAKSLLTYMQIKGTFFFKPSLVNAIKAQMLKNQLVTVTLPGGTTIQPMAYIDKFDIQEMEEGKPGLADVTIEITNMDDDWNEVEPVITVAA